MAKTKRKQPLLPTDPADRFFMKGLGVSAIILGGLLAYSCATSGPEITSDDQAALASAIRVAVEEAGELDDLRFASMTKDELRWEACLHISRVVKGINAAKFCGQWMVESSGSVKMVYSEAGAAGPMQIMPITAKHMKCNRLDPAENLICGAKYIVQLHERFKSEELAYAAFNFGPTRLEAWQKRGGKWSELPKETREYPGKVMKSAARFARMAKTQLASNYLMAFLCIQSSTASCSSSRFSPGLTPSPTTGHGSSYP